MEEQKLSPEIFDTAKENLKKLEALFPSAFKDGQLDLEALKQELGEFEEVGKEKYELTWTDKNLAKQLAMLDVQNKTLNYIPEDSKNPDSTENLYIEGDNLEVLKLLRKSYYSKIKMIYIDPPYNTGNDFVYNDNFYKNRKESDIAEGMIDEEGNPLQANSKSSNRYHANWLNMMYPRLKIARDLLTDDGVIFVSIDENEVANLRKICDEIFGEDNFVGVVIKQSKIGGGSDSKHIVKEHEYCIVVSKNIFQLNNMYIQHDSEYLKRYKEEDENGIFFWDTFARPGLQIKNEESLVYEIVCPDGKAIKTRWIRSKERFLREYADGTIRIVKKQNGDWSVQFKQYLNQEGKKPRSMTMDLGGTIDGKKEITELFGNERVFSYPKSIKYIKELVKLSPSEKDKLQMKNFSDSANIILDFFSGSSTTAHAVMQLNAEDGGNRKFIMVQWPEEVKEKENLEAFKFLRELKKPTNICEIGKERIRRAGEKIKQELIEKQKGKLKLEEDSIDPEKLDIGFKVFRVADTNIRWLKDQTIPRELIEGKVSDKDHLDFTPDFKDIDIVYEILFRHRDIPLSSSIEVLSDIGSRTYSIASTIVVCLEESITSEIVDKLAVLEPKPSKIIFRDSAFDDDISLKLNTLKRLDFQLKRFNEAKDQTYRVEFI